MSVLAVSGEKILVHPGGCMLMRVPGKPLFADVSNRFEFFVGEIELCQNKILLRRNSTHTTLAW
jgi:hypothetical protein